MSVKQLLNRYALNPELRGLSRPERSAVIRQLIVRARSGAEIGELLLFVVTPVSAYVLSRWLVPGDREVVRQALWLAVFAAVFFAGWTLLQRRMVRRYLAHLRCASCGSGFVGCASEPGSLVCPSCRTPMPIAEAWPLLQQRGRADRPARLFRGFGAEWKSIRELEGFDDGAAALLLFEAKQWGSKRLGVAMGMAYVVGMAAGMGVLFAAFAVGGAIDRALRTAAPRSSWTESVVLGAALVMGVIAGLTAGTMIWRHGVRAVVRRRLNTSRCARCDYTLSGVPRTDTDVRCPECGTVTPFATTSGPSARESNQSVAVSRGGPDGSGPSADQHSAS